MADAKRTTSYLLGPTFKSKYRPEVCPEIGIKVIGDKLLVYTRQAYFQT